MIKKNLDPHFCVVLQSVYYRERIYVIKIENIHQGCLRFVDKRLSVPFSCILTRAAAPASGCWCLRLARWWPLSSPLVPCLPQGSRAHPGGISSVSQDPGCRPPSSLALCYSGAVQTLMGSDHLLVSLWYFWLIQRLGDSYRVLTMSEKNFSSVYALLKGMKELLMSWTKKTMWKSLTGT